MSKIKCNYCGKSGVYYFHENAPAYCPSCHKYLTETPGKEKIDVTKNRSLKINKIKKNWYDVIFTKKYYNT